MSSSQKKPCITGVHSGSSESWAMHKAFTYHYSKLLRRVSASTVRMSHIPIASNLARVVLAYMIRQEDKCLIDVWYEREIDIYSSSIRVSAIHYITLLSPITTLIDVW